jgi:hypothetical protein
MPVSDNERAQMQAAFDASNAINDLDGVPFTARCRQLQERIIAGELTFDAAIAEIVASIRSN